MGGQKYIDQSRVIQVFQLFLSLIILRQFCLLMNIIIQRRFNYTFVKIYIAIQVQMINQTCKINTLSPQKMSKKSSRVQSLNQQKQKNVLTWNWHKQKSCQVGNSQNLKHSQKIASFDMDDTLLRVKSGAKFAKDADDWIFWHECVPKKMQQLQKDGYKLVIFTNQMGVSTGKSNLQHLKKKMQAIAKQMGIQMQVFLALEDDQYRKPGTKMWQVLENNNGGIQINKKMSFYCGDAAGRKNGKHKDFSDSDLKFGLNVGVEFLTPENLFLGDKQKVQVQGFNPKTILQNGELIVGKADFAKVVEYVPKQLVIFVGSPGSGKSTFWKNYMPKYSRVNRDTLKTKQKCHKVAEEYILKGNSVIVDNTNPKKQDRAYFIGLAKKHDIKVRCFRFLTPKEICFHNDYQRIANNKREHLSGKAGSIPIHSFFKYVQQPQLTEGFYEINQVNFLAKFFDNTDKEAYHQFSKK